MLILGLALIAAGALLLVAGLFTTEATTDGVEFLGSDISVVTLFLLGVAATLLVLGGLWLCKYGAARSWRSRKENRKLNDLSQKLDRVEAERRRDGGEASDGHL